jgi:EAL domain-containing protein (putative c-di-GMP-specific phosphodiesterase class I)
MSASLPDELHHLPITSVKFDRSLIAHLTEPGSAEADFIASMVTQVAQHGWAVAASGVETAAQLARLEALHVQFAQGYLLAEPLEGTAATELLGKE